MRFPIITFAFSLGILQAAPLVAAPGLAALVEMASAAAALSAGTVAVFKFGRLTEQVARAREDIGRGLSDIDRRIQRVEQHLALNQEHRVDAERRQERVEARMDACVRRVELVENHQTRLQEAAT